jgi:hypothetical protein
MPNIKQIVAMSSTLLCASVMSGPINQGSYGLLTGNHGVDFNDVAAHFDPNEPAKIGTAHDALVISGGVAFGEHFSGQILGRTGNFDEIQGTPAGPLNLLAGTPGHNLYALPVKVIDLAKLEFDNALSGIGWQGEQSPSAIGEGAISILFSVDQSQFGVQLLGLNNGYTYFDFYRNDGSLIQSFSVRAANKSYIGFFREDGIQDIRGVSIWNGDPNGMAIDNIKHDIASNISAVPGPATLALWLLGLPLLAGLGRRKVGAAA